MRMLALLALLASLTLIAGCSSTPAPKGAVETSTLIGPVWRVVELNGNKIDDAMGLRLEFAAESRVSGNTGVNSMFGTYTSAKPGAIAFSKLGMTRRAGPPPAMQIESEFTRTLEKVNAYRVDGAMLNLRDGTKVIIKLRR